MSLSILNLLFRFIQHARQVFTLILVTYYSNIPQDVLDKLPNFDPVERSIKEMEASDISVKSICEAANDALGGFFMADFTSDSSWNLKLSKFLLLKQEKCQ